MRGRIKSFTLIELLVVIAILGILAAMILVSVSAARAKGRDALRKSDLNALSKALETYYTDKEVYPGLYIANYRFNGQDASASYGNWRAPGDTGLYDELGVASGTYIKKLPIDPINTTGSNGYEYVYFAPSKYWTDGSWPERLPFTQKHYELLTRLENTKDSSIAIKKGITLFASPSVCTNDDMCQYCVKSDKISLYESTLDTPYGNSVNYLTVNVSQWGGSAHVNEVYAVKSAN